MSKRLQARWASIPGVIFPDETKAKAKRPAKAKPATKRSQKPATERYHSRYYAEPEKYTTRGKIRKTAAAPDPAPETWCSLTEAAKMLELSIARVSQLTKQLGIEQLVYFQPNDAGGRSWGAHKKVYYNRAKILELAAERAAKKAEVKISLQENALCWSCSNCIVVGRGLSCEAYGNSLYAGRVACTKYQRKETEQ